MELKLLVDDEWITLKSIEDFKTLKDKGHACCNISIDNEFEFEMLGNFIYTDLEDMKEKHQKIKECEDTEAFDALLEYFGSFKKAYNCWLHERYTYYPNVHNKYDLGYYIVHEDLGADISTFVFKYFNYEALGNEVASNGKFVKTGFITVY